METVEQIFTSLNTWLLCLLTGALLWVVQQVIPATLSEKAWWKNLMKVAPLLVGAMLALIPDLRPVPGSLVQSATVGFLMGSIAQSTYDVIRGYGPDRLRAILGARSKRINRKE